MRARARSVRLAVLVSAVAVAVALAGCAGGDMSGSLSSRVTAWAGSSGADFTAAVRTLQADVASVAAAVARKDAPSAKTDCTVLYQDVANDYLELPSPDFALTSDITHAYRTLSAATVTCVTSAQERGIAALRAVVVQLRTGLAELAKAQALIVALTATSTSRPASAG